MAQITKEEVGMVIENFIIYATPPGDIKDTLLASLDDYQEFVLPDEGSGLEDCPYCQAQGKRDK
jgi:hypothetical protein